ncbi:MAG TPA: CPBP family intramembrane glutamic endopeptidase [Phnomibacter sp.]|nr:CPBP family intramembrane glutamic endopeptidase [Phnomibacter sp.]
MPLTLFHKGFKPTSQIAVLLGVWGACFIAAALASAAILLLSGMPLGDSKALFSAEHAGTIRLMQAVSTMFIFGLPAVLYAFICFRNGWQVLGVQNSWSWKLAGLAVVAILATGPLTDALGELNKAIPLPGTWKAYFDTMEENYEQQVKVMLDIRSIGGLLISLLLMAALPALFEELFFRGGLQGLFTRWWRSPWVAIVVTAFLFSAIHFSWYGFFPRVMLGIVLGAVYYATGNLWYSILMHFVNNAAAVIYMYVLQQQGKPIDISQSSMFPAWMGVISAVFIAWVLYKLVQDRQPEIAEERPAYATDPFSQAEKIDIGNS